MGSTGSGKTTLLDTIAGRKIARGGKVVDGKVFINSFEVSRNDRTKKIGFVSQEDSLHGGFTVRETFFFSARLRYGYRVPRQEIELKVNNMLQLLGLQVCADVRIGNVLLRGISGGQKRRVSIGVELLVQHEILCLDEPTSGLDSIAAYSVIEELKSLSSKGLAILSTIHQPSSAIFQMFDKLLLMSAGRVVYFGPAKNVLNYFDAVLHMTCPDFFNPGDFVIDVISESFSQTGQRIPAEELEAAFNSSQYKQDMIQTFENMKKDNLVFSDLVKQVEVTDSPPEEVNETYPSSSLPENTLTLIHRGTLNLYKNPGIVLVRFIMYSFLSVAFGLAFLQARGNTNDVAIQAINSTFFIVPALFVFLSASVVPFYVEERPVFFREYQSRLVSLTSYVISSVIVSVPISVLLAFSSGIIVFFMLDLRNFGLFIFPWWLLFMLAETFSMMVAAVSPHFMIGLVTCLAFWGGACVVQGFLIVFTHISWGIRWLGYITPLSYYFRASMRNQWENFGNLSSPLFFNGEQVLEFYQLNSFGYQSYWLDVGIMLIFLTSFILGFHSASRLMFWLL